MNNQSSVKNYFKKAVIFLAVILILIAMAVFSDFLGKIDKPSGTAALSWSANTEPDLAGYKIYYGATSRTNNCPPGGYPQKVDIGNKTSYTIDKLERGKTYYFSITSYDKSGNESCFSAEVKKITSASKN